jgi:hypothetical protein
VHHGARLSVICRLTRRALRETVKRRIKTFLAGGVLALALIGVATGGPLRTAKLAVRVAT